MADFEFEIKSTSDLKSAEAAKTVIKEVTGALNEQTTATKNLTKAQADLADKVEKQRLRERQLGARSDERAGRSLLAKELAGNVAAAAGEEAEGGSLRTALRQGAQAAGLQGAGRTIASLVGPLGSVVALFAAVAAGIRFAFTSFKEFNAESARLRELNEALEVSGQNATAFSKGVADLAREREKNTGISDEKWLGAFQELLRGGAGANELSGFADKLEELKVITGSFETAVKLLTEAQRGNFDGFKTFGIFIDDHSTQVEKIKSLYEQTARASGILENSMSSAAKTSAELHAAFHGIETGFGQLISKVFTGPGLVKFANDWRDLFTVINDTTTSAALPMVNLHRSTINQVIAMKELNEQLDHQKTKLESLEKITDRMTASDKAAADAKKTSIDRAKDYQLALIDVAEAAGKRGERGGISAVKAAQQRLRVSTFADTSSAAVDQGERQKEVDSYRKQLKQLDENAPSPDTAQIGLLRAKDALKARRGMVTDQELKVLEENEKEFEIVLKLAIANEEKKRELRGRIDLAVGAKGEAAAGASSKIALETLHGRANIRGLSREEFAAHAKDPTIPITKISLENLRIEPNQARAEALAVRAIQGSGNIASRILTAAETTVGQQAALIRRLDILEAQVKSMPNQ